MQSPNIYSELSSRRKDFIHILNTQQIEIDSIDWADATVGFDRKVMEDIFWGVKDDDMLKSIVDAIIKTWNTLEESKDARCLEQGTPQASMAIAIAPFKFGGLFKQSIEDFFNELWIKRNALNAYSFKGTKTGQPMQKQEISTHKSIEIDDMSKDEIIANQGKEIAMLQTQLVDMEEVLNVYKETKEIDWHDKVRLELVLRIMEKAGINLDIYGNKARAAQILKIITKLPISTCSNYASNRDLNVNTHSEEIVEINSNMRVLNKDILL